MSEEAPEIKPSYPDSIDGVAVDTLVTPEITELKNINVRSPNRKVEVRARYLDTSVGSCHDYCKYGHKHLKESTSSFISKQRKKIVVDSKYLVVNQPLSPAFSTTKRASLLSTPDANSNTKYNDIILRNGIGVVQLSPSKGKKRESVPSNAPLSPRTPIKRVLSEKSRPVKEQKEGSRLKRHSSVGKNETKKPLDEKIFEEKGKAPSFEDEKGKQKSPGAVIARSSLISQKKSLGPKKDQNYLPKATIKLDRNMIPKEKPKKKVEPNSGPKRLIKKVGVEEKSESAQKLGFKRGKVVDIKTYNTAPRKLKFKPRKTVSDICPPKKTVSDDLNGKGDDVAGSKTELAKKMTNHKVEMNMRIKRVGKVGVEKKESLAYKLDFERGKVIDVQPKNTAPRRLKFKPRKVIAENVKGDYIRKNLKKVVGVDDVKGLDTEHLKVVLKHQDIEGKKDVQSLLNNVIEETATRLVRLRKSKVKALVGAFESLMSLPDAKSSTTSASRGDEAI